MEHLVQTTRCKTLFITHYPLLAASIQRKFPTEATNVHMAFAEEVGIDGIRTVTFLYALVEGISSGSYGIECARLAGLPESLLEAATEKAENMQEEVATRSRINQYVLREVHICIISDIDLGQRERALYYVALSVNEISKIQQIQTHGWESYERLWT